MTSVMHSLWAADTLRVLRAYTTCTRRAHASAPYARSHINKKTLSSLQSYDEKPGRWRILLLTNAPIFHDSSAANSSVLYFLNFRLVIVSNWLGSSAAMTSKIIEARTEQMYAERPWKLSLALLITKAPSFDGHFPSGSCWPWAHARRTPGRWYGQHRFVRFIKKFKDAWKEVLVARNTLLKFSWTQAFSIQSRMVPT